MRFRKRKIPQINSSSSADIAFLLLIFFLITSSLDSKTGIYRRMNPYVAENVLKEKIDIQERNLLVFTIDSNDHILNNKKAIALSEIKNLSKTFIANPNDLIFLPEKEQMEIIAIGSFPVTSKHTISLEVDRQSKYQTYISVLNELTAAYNELRNELALDLLNQPFGELNSEQQEGILTIYPFRVSEIEIDSSNKTDMKNE